MYVSFCERLCIYLKRLNFEGKMVIRNEFLINLAAHNNIVLGCFCGNCRNGRVLRFSTYTNAHLYDLFKNKLPSKDESRLDKYHQNVLDLIVAGKVYKESSLENTGYRYFKSWAKNQPRFTNWTPKEFNKFCTDVNETCDVYEHWDAIVRNLTDSRMDQVDARRFSVRYFSLAKSIDWCLSYNEMIRKKGKRSEEPLYPADKYNAIFQNILASGILDDIENDPYVASMIGGRLQADMVRHCRLRYQPH